MDFELARTLTHEALKTMLRHAQEDANNVGQFHSDMQVAGIVAQVQKLARKNGHIEQTAQLSTKDQNFVVHVLWELIIQGVLVPHNATSNTQGWPFVSFTDHGAEAIFAQNPTPYDPNGYLSQFGQADQVVRFYCEEALGCFRASRYTASVVMLGVASERLFDLLLEAFDSALKSLQEREQLKRKTEGRSIMSRYEELRKRLDPRKGQLPKPILENVDTFLVSIFNLIRQHRNDSGHPTGRAMTRDEAYALLNVFPHCHMQMSQLINHLRASPNQLT